MKNSVLKSKKFKYGGSAVALTVIVVALTLLLNVVVTSLSSTNSWYTDLTGASIYSISDKFEEELDKIVNPEGGEKKYINIVIMMDEDKFSEYSSYTNYVYHTIKQIEKKFDNVKLISKNIIKNPEEKERYQLNEADSIYLGKTIHPHSASRNYFGAACRYIFAQKLVCALLKLVVFYTS